MRTLARLIPAILVVWLSSWPALAADPESPADEPKKVFVPVQDWDEVVKSEPDGILLSFEEYTKLRDLARRNREKKEGRGEPAPAPAVLETAAYTARLDGKLLRVEATFRIVCHDPGPALLPLALDRIGVTSARLDGADAALFRTAAGTLELVVEGTGAHTLELAFVAAVRELPSGREVLLTLPPAPAARLTATLPGDLEIETDPPFADVQHDAVEDRTTLDAALGNASDLFLRFRPRTEEARLTAVVEADSALDLTVGAVQRAHWVLRFQVHCAPVNVLRWNVPEGWTISAPIKTPFPATWSESGGLLEIRLRSEQKGAFEFQVEMEREAREGLATVPLLEPLDVQLQRGTARVFVDKRFTPRLATLKGARIVDMAGAPHEGLVPFRAFEFQRPDPTIVVELRHVAAATRAFVRNLLSLDDKEAVLKSRALVRVREGVLFGLDIALPAGFVLEEAALAGAEGEWKVSGDGKTLRFEFPKPLPADAGFRADLSLRAALHTEDGKDTEFPLPVVATGAGEEEGVLAVSAPESLRVRERKIENLVRLDPGTQIGVFRIRDPRMRLAYRYAQKPWAGTLALRRETPQMQLVTTVLYGLRGSAVYAAAHLKYQIVKAGTDHVSFVLPATVGEGVMIQGQGTKPASREETAEGVVWTVPLQSKVVGDYDLYVTFPVSAEGLGGQSLGLPWIRGFGAGSEHGWVAVEASEEAKIAVHAEGLEETDPEEVAAPAALGMRGRLLFAYKFARPGWTLGLNVTRHEAGEVAAVIVERLSSHVQVAPDGGELTTVAFTLKESGLQDFRMDMPSGCALWSLTVDGQGVKPASNGNQLIVPLDPKGPTSRVIRAVYRRAHNRVSALGRFGTELPRVWNEGTLVPVLASSLTVSVPEDYQLLAVAGTMTPEFRLAPPRSLLRRLYERYQGFAVLLVLAVLAGVALITYNESVARLLHTRVLPHARVVKIAVGGAALLLLLVVLSSVFVNILSGSRLAHPDAEVAASAQRPGMVYEGEKGVEDAISDTPFQGKYENRAIGIGGGAGGAYGRRFAGRRHLRARDARELQDEEGEWEDDGDEALERDAFENEKEVERSDEEPPVEDPVLKDAEVADHLAEQLRKALKKNKSPQREESKGVPAKTAPDPEAAPMDGPVPTPSPQAPREPAPDGYAGKPSGGEEAPAEGILAVRGQGGGGGGGRDDGRLQVIGGTGGLGGDTRGLRTLAVDVEGRGRALPFRGEGGEDRVRVYLLGRGFRNGLGFLLFVAGLFLPALAVREWRSIAVAAIVGALLAFSLVPEVVPAFSGACNLGVVGLLFGLALIAVLPGVRWARHVTGRWLLPVVILAALLSAPSAFAGETGKKKEPPRVEPPAPARVYIPYDPEKADRGIPVEKVFLPYREFLRLWDLAFPDAATRPAPVQAPFAHVQAQYVGEIADGWLRGGAVFEVVTRGREAVEIPLGLKGAMVEGVKANGEESSLRGSDSGYAWVAPQAGRHRIEVTFRVKAEGEGKSGSVQLGLFPIPRSRAILRITDPVLTCEVPSALGGVERTKSPMAEVVTAYLGGADRLRVEYRPQEAGREGEFATLKARTVTYVAVEPALQRFYHGCSYEVVGSARDRFRFELSADLNVLVVKGPNLRRWALLPARDGRRILEIHLQSPEEKGAAYAIEGFRTLDPDAVKREAPLVRPMDCLQEEGSLAVETPAHLRLTVESRGALEPVDKDRIGNWKHPVAAAFRFSRRPVTLEYTLKERPVRLEGDASVAVMVAEEDVRLGAYITLSSAGAAPYELRLALPEGFDLDDVKGFSGPAIKDWSAEGEGKERILKVRLEEGLGERMALGLWMSRKISLKAGPASFPLPLVTPLGVEALKGRIVVHGFPGIRLQANDRVGLEPANAWEIWRGYCGAVRRPFRQPTQGALGFSFDGPGAGATVVAEGQAPVLSCTWTLHQRLRKDAVEYGLYLVYRAENAPAKFLSFSLPDRIPEESVVIPHFPGKREEERIHRGGRVVYRVGLQRGFLGVWRLAATIRLPMDEKTQEVVLPDVALEDLGGGEVKGFVIVENAESGAMVKTIGTPEGLERTSLDDVKGAGALPQSVEEKDVTFAYRAARTWSAAFVLETPPVEKGVDLEVDHVRVLTVLRRAGDSWNRVQFQVVNRARQFLEVVMPEGARVLSLTVAGEPARPGRGEDGVVLIPLKRGSLMDPAFSVELTFAKDYPAVSTGVEIVLVHPVVKDPAIKVGNVFWTVRAPAGFRYGFGGDMKEAVETRIQEQVFESRIRDTSNFLQNIDKLPQKIQAGGVINQLASNKANLAELDEAQRQRRISGRAYQQQRAQVLEQQEFLTKRALGLTQAIEEKNAQEEARDISSNAVRFNEGQEGLRLEIWDLLAPESGSWDLADELAGLAPAPEGGGGALQIFPAVPPASSRQGFALAVEPDTSGLRTFHFTKEGKVAELSFRPWKLGSLDWVGTLVKMASLVFMFLAAVLLGWLQEWQGWPYRRLWIWLVLLVAFGASLSSAGFALVVGLIAAWLVHRKTARLAEERNRKKPKYAL